MRVAKSGGDSPAPAKPAETPGSGLQDALLPPSSTLLGLGAGAPRLPGTCQACRWAPMASRLAESPAACHAGCCRVGIANPLRSVPDGPPGWQGSPAPCCPLGRLSASPGWPAPRGSWPELWQPGTVLSTWNHQDLQVLPRQVPCSRKAVSSENAETESCLWGLLPHLPGCQRSGTQVPPCWHPSSTVRALQAGRQLRAHGELLGKIWALWICVRELHGAEQGSWFLQSSWRIPLVPC